MKKTSLYISLYFTLFILHFGVWYVFKFRFELIFLRYYIFLTLLFVTVITFLSLFKSINPRKVGQVFLGLIIFKLIMAFIFKDKFNLTEVPNYKLHFILPYLFCIVLETLYAIEMVKDEKNQ